MMREKTKQGIPDHISQLKMTDEYLLLGDSHVQRLIWKFPQFAPSNTWLCGIGGDKAFQLSYRIHNTDGTGYTQHPSIKNEFKTIGIMIGTNDISSKRMKDDDIESIVKEVECMYNQLKQRWPNAEIKVFPIPSVPIRKDHRNQSNIDDYNQKLSMSGMVKSGATFTWELDLEKDFEDDVHLNASGYLKFTNQLMKVLF